MKPLIGLILLLLSTPLWAAPLPLDHFVKHGDYLDMQLSPDGKHIAARVRNDGKVYLVLLSTKDMNIVGGVKPGQDDILHSATWINNERLVYELAEKQYNLDSPVPTGELYAINIDGSQNDLIYGYRAGDSKVGSRISTRQDTLASQEILSLLESDEDHILIIEHPWSQDGNVWYDDRTKHPIITKLNIHSGRKKKLEVLPHPGAHALATREGLIQFMRWQDEQGNYHSAYRDNAESPWQDLSSAFNLGTSLYPRGLSENGKRVFLSGRTGDNYLYTLFELDIQSGEYSKLFEDHATDIENWIIDRDTGLPAVGISYPGKSDYHYRPGKNATAKLHKMLVAAFGQQTVDIASTSRDGKLLLVHVSSDINPGEFYLFERDTMNAQFLWANRSWIDPNQMRPKQPIELLARDETKLSGYLTLPAKNGESKPPLVVMIHGGPHQSGTRDFWDFDTEVQMLANHGYAVLQVNFRGSDGYGQVFIESGYREWGGKMIDDIVDATRWSIDQGLVDGDKVCAYGASYGGYAALMAAAKASDLYQCTIGYVGIYDLNYMFSESDIPNIWGGPAYLKRVLGTDKAQLDAFSPINYADEIKASVLLIHGAKDRRVPEINAEKMQERLEKAGNAPTFLRYKQSGHGVWDEDSRKDMYQGLLDFLARNLKAS